MDPAINVRQLIEVARPGLWATQLWFYLLPLGGYRLLDTVGFWLGAAYVTFPLGLLLYGWNDWADYETDRLNPRKGNLLFGAKLSRHALARLPRTIVLVQLPWLAAFVWLVGGKFIWWIAAAVEVNACYNLPRINFKGRPVADVLSQSGYLLVFVLASWVNDVPLPAWPVFLFGLLFAMHSHLLGEMVDMVPDRAAGRRTTAVVLGVARTKLALATLLLAEAAVTGLAWPASPMAGSHGRLLVAGFLALAGAGFLADLAARPNTSVTQRQLAVVLVVWNVVALGSMYFVWHNQVFTAGLPS